MMVLLSFAILAQVGCGNQAREFSFVDGNSCQANAEKFTVALRKSLEVEAAV